MRWPDHEVRDLDGRLLRVVTATVRDTPKGRIYTFDPPIVLEHGGSVRADWDPSDIPYSLPLEA